MTTIVDADTLTGLVGGLQAMIDYPAGLTCTLIQVPLLSSVGGTALAAAGDEFVVGGGRWLAPCSTLGEVGRIPGAWMSWSEAPLADGPSFFVNIAVNGHVRLAADGSRSYFGTLNETIPEGQTSCGSGVTVGPRHFTSKFDLSGSCVMTFAKTALTPAMAFTISIVTQTSAESSGLPFPFAGSPLGPGSQVPFSFIDNGNPGDANFPDKLQGPPAADFVAADCSSGDAPNFPLANGNITVHAP
ncbi:MAG: hypothetical protein E6I87_06920 [Chloroflexi bacterium]|nr:MAG: hypothetical protein E6I87_06920 [Chloroflexota bacterium]